MIQSLLTVGSAAEPVYPANTTPGFPEHAETLNTDQSPEVSALDNSAGAQIPSTGTLDGTRNANYISPPRASADASDVAGEALVRRDTMFANSANINMAAPI